MVILMDKELLNEINTAYYRLEMKQAEIIHALSHRILNWNPVGTTDTITRVITIIGLENRTPFQ